MIITAGKYKGRKIKTLKSNAIRPTSSKIRESIFSMTCLKKEGTIFYEGETRFLDLFAGSGIMGLEALSRGAKKAVFVEKSLDAIKVLKENISAVCGSSIAQCVPCDVAGKNARTTTTGLITGDSLRVLNRFEEGEFNFIFIDPPYAAGLYEKVLEKIHKNKILAENGVIVLEHDGKMELIDHAGFKLYKTKTYGDTRITILLN